MKQPAGANQRAVSLHLPRFNRTKAKALTDNAGNYGDFEELISAAVASAAATTARSSANSTELDPPAKPPPSPSSMPASGAGAASTGTLMPSDEAIRTPVTIFRRRIVRTRSIVGIVEITYFGQLRKCAMRLPPQLLLKRCRRGPAVRGMAARPTVQWFSCKFKVCRRSCGTSIALVAASRQFPPRCNRAVAEQAEYRLVDAQGCTVTRCHYRAVFQRIACVPVAPRFSAARER